MAGGNQIRFGVGFDVDKSGLDSLKKSLQDLQNLKKIDIQFDSSKFTDIQSQMDAIKGYAGDVQQAFSKAFNADLGTVNIQKLRSQLQNLPLDKIQQSWGTAGTAGQVALRNMATSAMTTNMQLKQTRGLLDQLGTSVMNAVKWQISSSFVNSLSNGVQRAIGYVSKLDQSLTQIRVVTGDSASQMAEFATQANKAAASLGRQTTDYTKAALQYYQQGLSDKEVQARTETTLKAANITGANVSNVANDLTAVWNGFNVQADQTQSTVDKLAAVADSSASDMSELASAMGKVASVAGNTGVSVDQLNAMLATTISVTRQAPESIGNAYKTIFARINDIKTGADDAEDTLGNYSGKMAELGINVLDETGHLRETGDVMEQVGQKWQTMSKDQQIYLAQTMAGQRQFNNLVALFDNWGQYQDMLNTSMNATGSLEQKNSVYMESLQAHTNQFNTAVQGLNQSLADTDSWKNVIDFGTQFINILTKLSDSIGGGGTALLGLGGILGRVFNKNITDEINNVVTRFQDLKANASALNAQQEVLNVLRENNVAANDKTTQQNQSLMQTALDNKRLMSAQDLQAVNNAVTNLTQARNELDNYQDALKTTENIAKEFGKITGIAFDKTSEAIIKDKDILADVNRSITATTDDLQVLKSSSSKGLVGLKTEIDSVRDAMQSWKVTGNLNAFNGQWDTARQKVDQFKTELKQVTDTMSTEVQGDISKIFTKFENAITNAQDDPIALNTAFNTFFQSMASKIQDLIQKGKFASDTLAKQAKDAYNNILGAYQGHQQKTKSIQRGIEQKETINNIVSFTSSLSQLNFVAQGTASVLQNLFDSSIGGGEKFSNMLSGLVTIVPSAIMGFNGMKTALEELGVAAAASNWITLLITGIAALIPVLTNAYDKMHVTEAEAKTAQSEIDQITGDINAKVQQTSNNIASLKDSKGNDTDLIKEFETLAQGVSNTGQNISLTSDEFDRYNQIVSELVAMSPSIVTGYTNEGNAILDKKNAIEQLIEAEQKQRVQAQILSDEDRNKLVSDISDVKKYAKESTLGQSLGKYTQSYNDTHLTQTSKWGPFESSMTGILDINEINKFNPDDTINGISEKLYQVSEGVRDAYQKSYDSISALIEGDITKFPDDLKAAFDSGDINQLRTYVEEQLKGLENVLGPDVVQELRNGLLGELDNNQNPIDEYLRGLLQSYMTATNQYEDEIAKANNDMMTVIISDFAKSDQDTAAKLQSNGLQNSLVDYIKDHYKLQDYDLNDDATKTTINAQITNYANSLVQAIEDANEEYSKLDELSSQRSSMPINQYTEAVQTQVQQAISKLQDANIPAFIQMLKDNYDLLVDGFDYANNKIDSSFNKDNVTVHSQSTDDVLAMAQEKFEAVQELQSKSQSFIDQISQSISSDQVQDFFNTFPNLTQDMAAADDPMQVLIDDLAQYKGMAGDAATVTGNLEKQLKKVGSLDELHQIWDSLTPEVQEKNAGAYGAALIKLAGSSDECAEALANYREAMLTGTSAEQQATEGALEHSIKLKEAADNYGTSVDAIRTTTQLFKKNTPGADAMGVTEQYWENLAIAQLRYNNSVKQGKGALDDLNADLSDNGQFNAESLTQLRALYADFVNLKPEDIDLSKVMDPTVFQLYAEAIGGDTDATKQLMIALSGTANSSIELTSATSDSAKAFDAATASYQDYLDALKKGQGLTQDDKAQTIKNDMSSKTSVEDLNNYSDQLVNTNTLDLSEGSKDSKLLFQEYSDALLNLAAQYDNCTAAIERYKQALANGDAQLIQTAGNELQLETRIGEASAQYGISADRIQTMTEVLTRQDETLAENNEILVDSAVQVLRLNDGIQDLRTHWSDYDDILQMTKDSQYDSNDAILQEIASSDDLAETFGNLKQSVADLLNTSEDMFGDDFILDNMDDIKAAAEGDEDALRRLQDAAGEEIELKLSDEGIQSVLDKSVDEIADWASNLPEGELGADDTAFLQALANAMSMAGMTQGQIESALGALQINADLSPYNAALNSAVGQAAAAGMAASNAFAGSAGVNTTATSETKQDTDTTQITGFTATPGTVQLTGSFPNIQASSDGGVVVGDPIPFSGSFPTVDVQPQNETKEAKKTNTFTAYKVQGASKSSGGTISNVNKAGGGGGGKKGGSCFVANTPITTQQGYKNIQDIKVGDIVLSYNEKSQTNEYSKVIATMIHDVTENIYSLYIGNDILEVTGIHRFLILRDNIESWIHAADLHVGDFVRYADGTHHLIKDIEIDYRTTRVYNFEVANNHNYYVGKNRILAHNKGKKCFVPGTPVLTKNGIKKIEDIQIGDIVLSYNEKFNQNQYSEVIDTMKHWASEDLYKIYIKNTILETTSIHKFLIIRDGIKEWLPAAALKIGDLVRLADNTLCAIDNIVTEFKQTFVYNFEVAGNHNYYVGKDGVLSHNKGKGGGSAATPKITKRVKDRVDPYYKINKQYNKIERSLKKLNKESDKAFGSSLQKNLQQQNKLLDQQLETIKKRQEIRKKDLADQKKQMSDLVKSFLGKKKQVTFDLDGNITNYAQLLTQSQAKVNKIIEKLNKAEKAGNKSKINKLKQQLDTAKDNYSELQKAIKLYDDTLKDEQDDQQELRDIMDEKIENNIKGFQAVVEVQLDLHEAQRDWAQFNNKYLKAKITPELDDKSRSTFTRQIDTLYTKFKTYFGTDKDDAGNVLPSLDGRNGQIQEQMANLKEVMKQAKLTEQVTKQINQYKDNTGKDYTIDELKQFRLTGGESAGKYVDVTKMLFGDNLEEARKGIKDAMQAIETSIKQVEEIKQDAHDNYMDALKAEADAWSDQLDRIKQVDDQINHDVKVLQQLYGNDSQSMIDDFYNQQIENNTARIETAKKERDIYEQRYQEAIKDRNQIEETYGFGSQEWNRAQEEAEQNYKNLIDSQNELNSAIEDGIDMTIEKWKNSMQQAVKEFRDQLAGGDFANMQDDWERQKEYNSRYLDRIERAQDLYQLESKIQDTINGTKNKSYQQKLLKFRDQEIARLGKINNLTQNDVDISNKKLEIIQKQMALEDAQNNKSQLRLRRDTQGNYTYQYTADDSNVKQATDDYMKSVLDLHKLTKKGATEVKDEIFDNVSKIEKELQDAADRYGIGTENFVKAQQEIMARHKDVLEDLGNQYYNNMIEGEKATFVNLTALRQQVEEPEFEAFLGVNGAASANSMFGAVQALIGNGGAVPSAMDAFTTDLVNNKFTTLTADNQDEINTLNGEWTQGFADTAFALAAAYNKEHGNYITKFEQLATAGATSAANMTDQITNDTRIRDHFDDLVGHMKTGASDVYTIITGKAFDVESYLNGTTNPNINSQNKALIDTLSGRFGQMHKDLNTKITTTTTDYNTNLRKIDEASDNTLTKLKEDTGQVLKKAKQYVEENAKIPQKFTDEATAAEKAKDSINALAKAWESVYSQIAAALQKAQDYYAELNRHNNIQNVQNPQVNPPAPQPQPVPQPQPAPQPQKKPKKKPKKKTLKIGDIVTFKNGVYTQTAWGGGASGNQHRGKKVKITRHNNGGSRPWHIATTSGRSLGWVTKSQLSYRQGAKNISKDQMAWTNEQPSGNEIILRKADNAILTKLKAGDSVIPHNLTDNLWKWGATDPDKYANNIKAKNTEITDAIKTLDVSNILSAIMNKIPMIGLNLIPEIANLINNITTNNDKQQENIQNVTINADFPNANSAEEIEKALNNLVNAASQRASKNRRSF